MRVIGLESVGRRRRYKAWVVVRNRMCVLRLWGFASARILE